MPPAKTADALEGRVARLEKMLDAFKDFDEQSNRSVRETLAKVKALADDAPGSEASGDESDAE